MSVRIMTMVWDIVLPDSQKIVMLALADCANDEGMAWPSIATLARKCSKSIRTVQGVISELVEAGHLTRREIIGKGCRYMLHPRRDCTPAESAPPQGTTRTPAESAPHPRRGCTQTVNEPSRTVRGGARATRDAPTTPTPDPVSDDWVCPSLDEFPETIRRKIEQWPRGAYDLACLNFRLHRQSLQPSDRKRNWLPLLQRWLLKDHHERKWVDFVETTAPGKSAAVSAPRPVAAKRHEDSRSADARKRLTERLGPIIMQSWFEEAALLITEDADLTIVVASEFKRNWIEQNFRQGIIEALAEQVSTITIKAEYQRPANDQQSAQGIRNAV